MPVLTHHVGFACNERSRRAIDPALQVDRLSETLQSPAQMSAWLQHQTTRNSSTSSCCCSSSCSCRSSIK